MFFFFNDLEKSVIYSGDAETGLFFKQFSGNDITDNPGDILAQGAMVELFAKLAVN